MSPVTGPATGDDRRRPAQYGSLRDERLRSWVTDEVYPYSRQLRPALDDAGLGRRGVRSAADLRRLPITPLAALRDGRRYVLEPLTETIEAHGTLALRARLAVAERIGRVDRFAAEHIDPAYRPVSWTTADSDAGSLFVASTATDLDHLATLGRRALATSGVRADDRVAVVDPAGSGIGPWQLVAGAHAAGVAVLHLDRHDGSDAVGAVLERAAPTVVAARAGTLTGAVTAGLPSSVRLLVVHDGPPPTRDQTAALAATGLPLAAWWTPPGARAAWVRCPGGVGYHTWPTDELVEIVDGRLVWSAVGWRGSVWLRVDTGVRALLDHTECAACGRTTPRVQLRRPSKPRPRRPPRRAAPA